MADLWIVGRDVDPGEYVVHNVAMRGCIFAGFFREDGRTRALALTEAEYIRALKLLQQGYAGVTIVRD